MKRTKNIGKFHFENGLLKELRAKAAPVNQNIVRTARSTAKKAANKTPPKSVLASLPRCVLRRLIAG